MTTIIENDVQKLFSVSDTGPFLQAEILPVSGQGNVRVTFNWLYSSLNCDPTDSSSFPWTFVKIDDTHVALSPGLSFQGMTLYASVRPDINYGVQVQAPFSADWITGIGGDETITINIGDLLTASFQGLNGSFLTVNASPDDQVDSNGNDHSGYRWFSAGSDANAALCVLKPTATSLQAGIEFRQTLPWTPASLQKTLSARGVSLSADQLARLASRLSPARPQKKQRARGRSLLR